MPNDKELDMSYVLRLEPELAVDYLRAKGVNITWDWHEQLEEAHARAFTVAKATRAEVLDTLRWATEKAIVEGVSEREYIKQLEPMLKELGWWGKTVDENGNTVQLGSPRRLKTILRTNKLTAYHAARYAEQMANVDEQPYWQYVAVKDSRTRASHLALHGKVYRADDPIWQTMYPPNDWGCRCRVRALSEFALKKQGLSVSVSGDNITTETAIAGINKDTGEEICTTVSRIKTDQGEMKVGAGWNYNVGSAAFGTDVAVIRKLRQVKNRELRQQTIQAINDNPIRHKLFEQWVKSNLGKRGASARYMSAGLVTTDIAKKVAELSGQEKTSELVLVMTEKRLEHANSDKHHQTGVGLTVDEYASISRIIAKPGAVLWDSERGHNNLIYLNQDKTIKVVVDAPSKDKLKPAEKVDAVINAYRVDYAEVLNKIKSGVYKIVK
ncbi:phage head morphogenesis protein [Mannheimia haemolytica]|uniref:phage head morphogenesis protein n=1 Tax=Mannheimia haemolytica TaxID=75985 RepID=UPI000386C308|nr:phage head morphogenesis protein [Mannheimia haemolytica]EPZ00485.1 F protein [Mannheimia haemolytica D35]MDW1149444.1 phage head morphogenesis protein [Mannheimia haemolytica]MDW1159540.1 phage head morphogenesis protein [Mannheimia haemolytica]